MRKNIFLWLIGSCSFLNAQTSLVFVYFTGKPNKAAFYANPLSELSQKSLDRRANLGIALNDQDAPIEPSYIQNIVNLGFTVTDYSKWLNGVVVNATPAQVTLLQAQPYVSSVESFAKNSGSTIPRNPIDKWNQNSTTDKNVQVVFNYSASAQQIDQVNIRPLHLADYTGNGVSIAVIDTGFPTVDTGSVYERIRNNNKIKGGYNFISKNNDIYNTSLNNHGSGVLGVIGGYIADSFVGSAPDADFYLYCTEIGSQEIPEEEIYWIEAAEEADRKGVDIITSSLGYYFFDDPQYNYTYANMNGTTSFIARGAEIAVNKGIFVLSAAGNSGNSPWHYLLTPADNTKVFTIGGVDSSGNSSVFSSFGPNSAGAIKPDGSALATNATYVFNNSILTSNGTSIATPIAAGGVACLLQAFPNMNRDAMRNLLRQKASLYPNHTDQMGYGILNFGNAFQSVLSTSEVKKSRFEIYPNPTQNIVNIKTDKNVFAVDIYDNLGRLLDQQKNTKTFSIQHFPKGIYYLKINIDHSIYYEKLLKN